ncbi:hypothetical protein PVA44_07435 (plasmid) [Entomospira nematocerorum]|uniref:DUF2326 domain-containing protein n=1 Tax=Entomospira nematocerorum TaxID=2719987 RepID=A0A968GGA9_9SPIO|nr:hypothetical protein [Entomospira nematocera]NIZ47743.1 hypothetical protein [Entomospira nematocera]WDI34698.1 hypothetical protein PVA44_07435 [Entomospira nematocera]
MLKELLLIKLVDKSEIRKITFKEGLNLIIDKQKKDDTKQTASGNGVGKTMFVDTIDFCLGANYSNEHNRFNKLRTESPLLFKYLEDNQVAAKLTLESDLDGTVLTIQRNLYNKNGIRIDDKPAKVKELDEKLLEFLYNEKKEKDKKAISYRTLLKWNLRDVIVKDPLIFIDKLDRPHTNGKFHRLYQFFNVPGSLIKEVQVSIDSKKKANFTKKEEKDLKVHQTNVDNLKKMLEEIDKEINSYDRDIHDIKKISEDYLSNNEEIRKLILEKNRLSTTIANFKDYLEKIQNTAIDKNLPDTIQALYTEMYISIQSNIIDDFNKLCQFHNSAIESEIIYLKHRLEELGNEYKLVETQIKDYEGFNVYYKDVERYHNHQKQKLDTERQIYEHEISLEKLEKKRTQFEKDKLHEETLYNSIREQIEKPKESIERFNSTYREIWKKTFSDMSRSFSFNEDSFDIEYFNVSQGAGKHVANLIFFSIALMKHIAESGLIRPLFFSVTDFIESVDKNQRDILWSDICKNYIPPKGQLIIPLLQCNFDASQYDILKESVILELDENDRFLRYENS